VKILIDMNLSPEWTLVFTKYGIESLHWSTVGDPRATDRVIMEWARVNDYAVFTHDLDFGALLAATQAGDPSVIQVRIQDVLPANIESLIVEVFHQFEPQIESGAFISVDETRSRVRILPITLR
jgi:predicted nuclease of predicted toxin-antitoxin system